MKRICGRAVCVFAVFTALVSAQSLLSGDMAAKVDRALAQGIRGDVLKCSVKPIRPFLDFAFRFNAGFVASCPVKEFGGQESSLIAYLRITPQGRPPVVLAQGYRLPAIPPPLAKHMEVKRLKTEFETSGAFVLGEGQFTVDLLLVDNRSRIYQKQWAMEARRTRSERSVPLAVPANTAAAFPVSSWSGKPGGSHASGSRLTILLDAAPINPYAIKLRAWDRSFLLGALSSLLRETPAEDVRLIAFNLDQQREIFHQDHFNADGFAKLSRTLENLELGTVSYKALQKGGWAELLARLVNQEISRPDPSGSVVFLGPSTRTIDKIPPTMLLPRKSDSPQFFYLEYFPVWRGGSEFPDAIHHATNACKGTVLKIHSPGEFAEAMRKVNERMQVSATETEPLQSWQLVNNRVNFGPKP
ncbi:MAG TPA: hypothetical protein VLJ11_03300 [Bryobacteraceae bacterium]|nr:hypothetical protein [Bryobacteraceae bacterium]